MQVKNMQSANGNTIANQFIIDSGEGAIYFQSYNSIIVKKAYGDIYLDKNYWNYSKTTSKYRNLFLGEDTKTIEKKIKDGTYTLTDLNQ